MASICFEETRLISLEGMSREDWLDLRREGVGGSDAGTICGVNPWQTARELYHIKRGEIADADDSEIMEWGRRLEPVVMAKMNELMSDEGSGAPQGSCAAISSMVWSDARPGSFVDLDGVVTLKSGDSGVYEGKTTNQYNQSEWGPSGSDDVPISYFLQCQHGMMVCGLSFSILAVLIGGQSFRWYYIERDDELIEGLWEAERNFLESVRGDNAPEHDYENRTATARVIKRVYGAEEDGEVVLPIQADSWCETMEEFKRLEKVYADGSSAARLRLLEEMGNFTKGIVPGNRFVVTRTVLKTGTVSLKVRRI